MRIEDPSAIYGVILNEEEKNAISLTIKILESIREAMDSRRCDVWYKSTNDDVRMEDCDIRDLILNLMTVEECDTLE